MSNKAYLSQDGSGFTIEDNYACAHGELETDAELNDLDLLRVVKDTDNHGILDFVAENKNGLTINGTHYSWDEISPVLDA